MPLVPLLILHCVFLEVKNNLHNTYFWANHHTPSHNSCGDMGSVMMHLWHFLAGNVPNVDVLARCNTFYVESQLQSKRLTQLGHTFRMPKERLPNKLLVGQVKGGRPPGCTI